MTTVADSGNYSPSKPSVNTGPNPLLKITRLYFPRESPSTVWERVIFTGVLEPVMSVRKKRATGPTRIFVVSVLRNDLVHKNRNYKYWSRIYFDFSDCEDLFCDFK